MTKLLEHDVAAEAHEEVTPVLDFPAVPWAETTAGPREAQVMMATEERPGRYCLLVRCPYCCGAHHVDQLAADLLALQRLGDTETRVIPAQCRRSIRRATRVSAEDSASGFVLRGFGALVADGHREDYETSDPWAWRLSQTYTPIQQVEAALALIRSAPGLSGIDIEHFGPTPVAKLTLPDDEGAPARVLMLTVQPVPFDESPDAAPVEALHVVLQSHVLVDGRYQHEPHDFDVILNDPGSLLMRVQAWKDGTNTV